MELTVDFKKIKKRREKRKRNKNMKSRRRKNKSHFILLTSVNFYSSKNYPDGPNLKGKRVENGFDKG